MRVICHHCKHQAAITTSKIQSAQVTDLYCRCKNAACQAGFVMTLGYKHDTQPPIHKMKEALHAMICNLSEENKQNIRDLLSN